MLIPKHTKTFQWEETAPPPMPRQYALMKPKPYDSKASKLWESPGVLLGSLGFSWVLLGSLGFSWVLLGSLGFSWYLLVSDGYGPVKSKDSGRHGVVSLSGVAPSNLEDVPSCHCWQFSLTHPAFDPGEHGSESQNHINLLVKNSRLLSNTSRYKVYVWPWPSTCL